MRKDKNKAMALPANYWASVVSRDVAMERSQQDEEARRKMAASARENSPVDEEARRMESRSMREAGPSIMDKMKSSQSKKMATKKLASAPMFQKK